MSSADSGRYQSRLFNFVYKQSRRFTRSCDRAWRNIQITASWVAAVGLYPLLLLFESTRSTANQIHQAVQQTLPQLPAPQTDPEPSSVDTPIQQVLLSIDALSSQHIISPSGESREAGGARSTGAEEQSCPGARESVEPNSSLAPSPQPPAPLSSIQGIATQLSSQTLVLVTDHNEILDILTSTQQEKLQAQIITAVADEGRYQRLAWGGGRGTLGATENYQLPYGRVIRHTCEAQDNSFKPVPTNYQLPNLVLGFLDRTIAVVESNHVVPVKSLAIALFSTNSRDGLVGRIQTGLAVLSKGKWVAKDPNGSSTTDTIRIQALIKAAIDYFFGTRTQEPLEQTTPKSDFSHRLRPNWETAQRNHPSLNSTNSQTQAKQLKGRYRAAKLSVAKSSSAHLCLGSQSVNPGIEDPWLCESDLFGESVTSEKLTGYQPNQLKPKAKISGSRKSLVEKAREYSLGNLVNIRKFLLQPKPASEIVKRQNINNGFLVAGISTKQSPPLFKSPRQDTAGEIFASSSNTNTQIQPAPDWIETDATAMGYVKHPLEQLLAWLDRAMLWLEEILLKIWQWLMRG